MRSTLSKRKELRKNWGEGIFLNVFLKKMSLFLHPNPWCSTLLIIYLLKLLINTYKYLLVTYTKPIMVWFIIISIQVLPVILLRIWMSNQIIQETFAFNNWKSFINCKNPFIKIAYVSISSFFGSFRYTMWIPFTTRIIIMIISYGNSITDPINNLNGTWLLKHILEHKPGNLEQ